MKTRSTHNKGNLALEAAVVILASVFLFGCGPKLPPLKIVASVDIPRFMGD
jgi:hypothetical protein